MSVLIKGIHIPTGCAFCFYNRDTRCLLLPGSGCDETNGERRRENCPIIEIPDHGDLIDRDELYRKTAEWEEQARNQVNEGWTKWNIILTERTAFKFDVADAPVVIPAERSEDGET